MSDQPNRTGLTVFAPEAALIKAWMVVGAIFGFLLSLGGMIAASIADAQEPSALQVSFSALLVGLGAMQGIGIGFCVGYAITKLRRLRQKL